MLFILKYTIVDITIYLHVYIVAMCVFVLFASKSLQQIPLYLDRKFCDRTDMLFFQWLIEAKQMCLCGSS